MSTTLRNVSKEECFEFLRHMAENPEPPGSDAQSLLIYEAMTATDVGKEYLSDLYNVVRDHGIPSAILTAFMSGFQHGREFENRLMARALRSGR